MKKSLGLYIWDHKVVRPKYMLLHAFTQNLVKVMCNWILQWLHEHFVNLLEKIVDKMEHNYNPWSRKSFATIFLTIGHEKVKEK